MGTWKQLGTALSSYGKAFDFIFRHGLWKYFFISLIISVVLWVGGYFAIDAFSHAVSGWVTRLISGWFGMDGGGFLSSALEWVFSFLIKILTWYVFLILHKYILLILISPLMAYVSEKVDEIITGRKYPFNADQLMRDVVRGIGISLRNLCIELGFTMLFFFISFIPIIGTLVSMVCMFIISSYFYGFSMMDYTNERRRLSIRQSVTFIKQYKGIAIGNGMIFSVFFVLPVIGPIVAPLFIPIWSVVAATLAINDVIDLKKAYGEKK